MSRLRHPYFLATATLLLALLVTFSLVKRPVKAEREADRRQAEGRSTPMKYMAPAWLWRGLRADLVVAGALLALTPLAVRRFSATRSERSPATTPMRPAEWLGLAAAVAVFTTSGIPRLGHSLWGDEEYAAGKFVADQVEVAADGTVTITPVPWIDTLWNYWRPTNHMGFTVVSRLCHDAFFQRSTGPTDPFMSETLIRLPTLLAGIASIFLLVWACRVWGWARAAVPVALAYSGHAWLVRFGVDARGYGFVLMLVPLLIGILGRALQSGLWRWWIPFGLVQFYLLWTYLGNIHLLLSVNLAALWTVWKNEVAPDRQVQLTRWLVGNLVTLVLVVGIMAPMLIPFVGFMKANHLSGSMDHTWLTDAATYLTCGAPWYPWSQTNPFCTALVRDGLPTAIDVTLLLIAWGIAAAGAWALWKKPEQRGLLIFAMGGPTFVIGHLVLTHTKPYHWYIIPFLPALLMLWCAGLSEYWRQRRGVAIALAAALIGSIHVLGWQQARLLVAHPIEANRESVALTRSVTNPRNPAYGKDAMTACCIMTAGSYDPAALRFKTVDELQKIVEQARQEKRPLLINFGFRELYQQELPELLAKFDDRTLFEPVATLPGLFFSTSREVIRLRSTPSPP